MAEVVLRVRQCAVLLLLLAVAADVDAQDGTGRSSISTGALSGAVGVVLDSINGGVLPGAVVEVEGLGARTVTDASGEFRLDSLPAGTHRFLLSHPLIDSLGFEIASAPVELQPGRYSVVAMAVPSLRTLQVLLCPPRDTLDDGAMLIGRVIDPDTHEAIENVRVSFVYTAFMVSGDSGIRRTDRLREGTTRADGGYVICGLPDDVAGTVQALHDGYATPEVPVRGGDRPLMFRNLSIPRAGVAVAATVSRGGEITEEAPPARGSAIVVGRVVDPGGGPAAGAQVAIVGTAALTTTDSAGLFRLDGLASGTSEVVARKIGFSPVSAIVELRAQEPQSVTLALGPPPAQTLAQVTVRATMSERLRRVGFEDRRRMGIGRFMDAEQIERRAPMQVTDIIRNFPGFRIVESEFGRSIVPTRSVQGQSGHCINLFVDHARWEIQDPGDLDRAFQVIEIAAVETYAGDFVPQEFIVPTRYCPTIVIWTKRRLDER